MGVYKHGIEVTEKATSLPEPMRTRYGVQVVFGTAPVNLAKDPYRAANCPVLVTSFDEAEAALGFCWDWKHYTLCQSMYASFRLFQVSPVIYVNVLDPKKHVKDMKEESWEVSGHQALIQVQGLLKDTLAVRVDEGDDAGIAGMELRAESDYISSFDSSGRLMLTLLKAGAAYGAKKLMVSGKLLDPELVKEEDLIGAYDAETGADTGLETIRQIYPRYGIAPGMLLAPGWTEQPNVGAALQGKCEEINGVFRCMCLLDLDTELAVKYTDCKLLKDTAGYNERHSIVLWPKLLKDGRQYSYSAVYGAMASHYTAVNHDVPYLYPSNKELYVDGCVLDDGTEVMLDQVQAGNLNGDGVVTAVRDKTWKSYGNNTGCYPEIVDPKDRWIGCRRMFDYISNYFAVTYQKKLDSNMNRRMIDDIVNNFNIWGSSLVADGMCAGIRAEYRQQENTLEDVLAGHLKLRIYFAPYTPAEYIHTAMEFDVDALKNAMKQEE